MDGPLSKALYEAAFLTDTMASPMTITMVAGTPMDSVSMSAGSLRSICGRMRMPLRLSAGIWMAICTKMPSGLPMAMMSFAASGSLCAKKAYSTNVVVTMTLLKMGAALLQR